MDYKNAGVDIEAGYKSVQLMKNHIKETMRREVLTNVGGFSGAFSLKNYKDMESPTLISGTDGVGTKLKIAFLLDKHDTIGIDCVAMCVNDIICAGAEPLFFLDYIACGKNVPERIATIVSGIAEGCKQSGASLIGGETAEMPGFYKIDEYDLAGFAVGIVDEKNIIDGKSVKEKDVIIGISSSGIHSNGYSLVRNVFNMKREALGKCPVCGSELHVTKLSCNNCHTHIEGNFNLCKFCKLEKEQKDFVEIFIKSRGNIKEIEKEMGISYPTVRGKLENVIEALGYSPKYTIPKVDKKQVLSKLNSGEITSEEALKLLQGE